MATATTRAGRTRTVIHAPRAVNIGSGAGCAFPVPRSVEKGEGGHGCVFLGDSSAGSPHKLRRAAAPCVLTVWRACAPRWPRRAQTIDSDGPVCTHRRVAAPWRRGQAGAADGSARACVRRSAARTIAPSEYSRRTFSRETLARARVRQRARAHRVRIEIRAGAWGGAGIPMRGARYSKNIGSERNVSVKCGNAWDAARRAPVMVVPWCWYVYRGGSGGGCGQGRGGTGAYTTAPESASKAPGASCLDGDERENAGRV